MEPQKNLDVFAQSSQHLKDTNFRLEITKGLCWLGIFNTICSADTPSTVCFLDDPGAVRLLLQHAPYRADPQVPPIS